MPVKPVQVNSVRGACSKSTQQCESAHVNAYKPTEVKGSAKAQEDLRSETDCLFVEKILVIFGGYLEEQKRACDVMLRTGMVTISSAAALGGHSLEHSLHRCPRSALCAASTRSPGVHWLRLA